MKYSMLFFTPLFALLLVRCASPEYKGDMAYITNVPCRIIEREARLLKERINRWARQVDYSDRTEGTTENPYKNDQGVAIRLRISSARRVLRMLRIKLKSAGATKPRSEQTVAATLASPGLSIWRRTISFLPL